MYVLVYLVPVALGLAPGMNAMMSALLPWTVTQPNLFGPLQAISAFYNARAQAGSGFAKAPFYPGTPVPVW